MTTKNVKKSFAGRYISQKYFPAACEVAVQPGGGSAPRLINRLKPQRF
jgi:hypothetical protein